MKARIMTWHAPVCCAGGLHELNGVAESLTQLSNFPTWIMGIPHRPAFTQQPGLKHLRGPLNPVQLRSMVKHCEYVCRIICAAVSELHVDIDSFNTPAPF